MNNTDKIHHGRKSLCFSCETLGSTLTSASVGVMLPQQRLCHVLSCHLKVHAKVSRLLVTINRHCVLVASFSLSLYSLHVLHGNVNINLPINLSIIFPHVHTIERTDKNLSMVPGFVLVLWFPPETKQDFVFSGNVFRFLLLS